MKTQFYIILLFTIHLLSAAEQDFRGQLSLQGGGRESSGVWYGNAGLQYIPNLQISQFLSGERSIDFEASVYGFINLDAGERSDDLRPYRFNFRYATPQSETQLGLQKINFGPAQLLRALMWFDRQNPTDPMNIAEGVWGLRYRYGFLNNANVWLWGLYGNDEPKGLEACGSVADKPEFGGRIQTPVPLGEMALTFHSRTANNRFGDFRETRYALDGRWDVLVGAWFEAVVQYQEITGPFKYTKMLTTGLDYTVGIGNGLYVLTEYMISQVSDDLYEVAKDVRLSALMLNYPLSMFDNLSLLTFYSWETKDFIQYASWQRSYDNIVVNLALYHFPEAQLSTISSAGAGYGVRLMLIYNH